MGISNAVGKDGYFKAERTLSHYYTLVNESASA